MRMALQAGNRRRGFSLLELIIVTAILLTISALAVPNIVNVVASVRMRASINTLSGLLQDCRMLAVKHNRLMSTHFTVLANGPLAYIKTASAASTAVDPTDQQVMLGAPVTKLTSLTGTGAPSLALDSTFLNFTPDYTHDPTFNSRGLPCFYDSSTGTCLATGFVFYFTDVRALNQAGWAAVSISPAGRVKTWVWTGSTWSN